MKILIIYGSLEGQTEKIAHRIARVIQDKEHQVSTLSGDHLPTDFSVEQYDAVIIGGAIHMGNYPKSIKTFVNSHRVWLNKLPSAFYTVCMAIHSEQAKAAKQALQYSENFTSQTGWEPQLTETFAGAVKYTQYSLVTRFIMKMISKKEGGSTDTSRDHEYTDWDSVDQFVVRFLNDVTEK